jgi:hypothetical protein
MNLVFVARKTVSCLQATARDELRALSFPYHVHVLCSVLFQLAGGY